MKNAGKVILSIILGWLFSGGIDLDDITFQRNIRKLKKEKWFKKLSDDGYYYENIYHNPNLKGNITKKGIVNKIIQDQEERDYFLKLIHKRS